MVGHTKDLLKKAVVDVAVENALSFRPFSTPSFKSLIGEMAMKLRLSLDRDQVRGYVVEAAQKEKDNLKKELEDFGEYRFLESYMHPRGSLISFFLFE